MRELIPAILAQDETIFRERMRQVEHHVATIHIDVMDGAFVSNRTWFDPVILREIKTPLQFEFHLMVMDPARHIEALRDVSTFFRVIWHIETPINHAELITIVHEMKKEPGLAISPTTSIDQLAPYASELREILIMGGEPGRSGQHQLPATIERAREIHTRWPNIPLGFDIGVNAETIPTLRNTGIERFYCGSAIFNADEPTEEIKKLQHLIAE